MNFPRWKLTTMAALVGVLVLSTVLVASAAAHTNDGAPAPKCDPGYHAGVQNGKAVCIKDTTTTPACNTATVNGVLATVCSQSTSTINVSIKYNYIGTWDMAAYPIKKVHGRPACFWAYGTWMNSLKTPVVKGYKETSRAEFCWLKKPVTVNGITYTAVKVAGGLTGSHCKNLAIPPGQPQPKPQIIGPVLDVRSLTNFKLPVTVNAVSNANASLTWNCPGGTLQGGASASASLHGTIKVTVNQSLLANNKGKTHGSVQADIQQQISESLQAQATTKAVAKVSVSCSTPPPPPPTTTTTTTTTSTTPSPPPPPPPSVSITSQTTLNDIPEGKTSGPFHYTVNASASGSITIDPGVGGVSSCSSNTKQDSLTAGLSAGNNDVCVIFYAPSDSGTNSMTVKATAIVGSAKDTASETFSISHPTRP